MTDERTEYIGFYVTPEEKAMIRENADKQQKSMSSLIRTRTVKPEMTNNEVADMIMRHVGAQHERTRACACSGIDIGRISEREWKDAMVKGKSLKKPLSLECKPDPDVRGDLICELKLLQEEHPERFLKDSI